MKDTQNKRRNADLDRLPVRQPLRGDPGDVRPELYTHYYENEFPVRFHARMDTRRWGPGERVVFEPYSKEVFEASFARIATREIFEPDAMGSGSYDQATISLAAT